MKLSKTNCMRLSVRRVVYGILGICSSISVAASRSGYFLTSKEPTISVPVNGWTNSRSAVLPKTQSTAQKALQQVTTTQRRRGDEMSGSKNINETGQELEHSGNKIGESKAQNLAESLRTSRRSKRRGWRKTSNSWARWESKSKRNKNRTTP